MPLRKIATTPMATIASMIAPPQFAGTRAPLKRGRLALENEETKSIPYEQQPARRYRTMFYK